MTGRVTNVTDYGAFVELEDGVEGLVHVSEMSWSKKVKNPSKVVSPGDTVEAIVSDVNPEARRISLSLKDTLPDPWDERREKYAVGSRVAGKVRNLTDFGAFVEIEEGIDGLVHVSDMSWTKRVKHPSEVLQEGRRRRGDHHVDRPGEPADLALDQGIPAQRLADLQGEAPARRRRRGRS